MKILFITATRIGDAVLSTGLLSWLHERHPEARFTVACGPVPAPLFADFPFVERVLPMVKRRRAGHWRDLLAATMGHYWHSVVDLRGSATAYVLPTLRRKVLRSSWAPEHRLRHLARLYDLDPPPSPRLWLSEASISAAQALIPHESGPVLGIGPTANWGAKQWPAENFCDLIHRLTASGGPFPGARIAVFGAPDERAIAQAVLDAVAPDKCIDLVGNAPLPVVAAALGRCAFYIGNDSGLMHMSAAMGIPTLGLFGPSSEVFYGPWGDHCASIRGPRSFEDICHAADFHHLRQDSMMQDLTIDRVMEAVTALWAKKALENQGAL